MTERETKLFPFISSQKYNVAVKKIFTTYAVNRMLTVPNPTTGVEDNCSINEIASSHLARRTFIGNLYKKGKRPQPCLLPQRPQGRQ